MEYNFQVHLIIKKDVSLFIKTGVPIPLIGFIKKRTERRGGKGDNKKKLMNTSASSKSDLVPDSDNTPIDLKGNTMSSLMGKEESLIVSNWTHGKTVKMSMIEPMLMKTKMYYYCGGAEKT